MDSGIRDNHSQPVRDEPQKPVREFADELADAYSTDRYNGGWSGAIRMLRKEYGWNDREIEAFIRSKHTRWAGDVVSKGSHVTVSDLRSYVAKYGTPETWKEELAELVEGTFQ